MVFLNKEIHCENHLVICGHPGTWTFKTSPSSAVVRLRLPILYQVLDFFKDFWGLTILGCCRLQTKLSHQVLSLAMWQWRQKHRDGGGMIKLWKYYISTFSLELGIDYIFAKAGEEWTTIAKTKGKKKTKPEDEWQEVNENNHFCPNYWWWWWLSMLIISL